MQGRLPNPFTSIANFVHSNQVSMIVVGVTALVVTLGLIAHVFKKVNRQLYGFVEIIFGSISGLSAGLAIKPPGPSLANWVTIAGAAFVVARGVGNYVDGGK